MFSNKLILKVNRCGFILNEYIIAVIAIAIQGNRSYYPGYEGYKLPKITRLYKISISNRVDPELPSKQCKYKNVLVGDVHTHIEEK